MKRLLNATLAGVYIKREQLALWTIASLRWPLLAEYLEDEPHMTQYIEPQGSLDEVREDLRKLFRDPDVISVFKGEGVGEVLDEMAVKTCASLRTSSAGNTPVA